MDDFYQWIGQAYPDQLSDYRQAVGSLADWAEEHLPDNWPEVFRAYYGIPYVDLREETVLLAQEDFQSQLDQGYLWCAFDGGKKLVCASPSSAPASEWPLALGDRALIQAALWAQLAPPQQGQLAEKADIWLDLDHLPPGRDVETLVGHLLSAALAERASDLHLEPGRLLTIRIRQDGLLKPLCRLEGSYGEGVINRIKLAAHMDIGEHVLPLDGQFKLLYRGKRLDVRVASLATRDGEKLVLRFLPEIWQNRSLVSLGYTPEHAAHLRRLARAPHGLIVLSGPTNSGKTTTLYALLNELKDEEKACYTIEDSIEITLPGVNQVQVNPNRNLDFPRALRGILRLDPDVILVGELRDAETAQIAVQAAMTGHLVLTTIHAYEAHAVFHRLLDLGVSRELIASILLAAQCQRLVAARCLHADAGNEPCPLCHDSGEYGQLIVEECWTPDDEDRALMRSGADGARLRRASLTKGFCTMEEDGLKKVAQGQLSSRGLARVFGPEVLHENLQI